MSSARLPVRLALLAGALATLASACTGTAPNQQAPESKSPVAPASEGTGMSASPAAGADPLAGLSGYQIVTRAIADTEAASFVSYTGKAPVPGQFTPVWLVTAKGKGCSGTIRDSAPAGQFGVIVRDSSVWLQPDSTFWASGAGAASSALAGKYLAVSPSSKYLGALAGLCALGPIFQGSGSAGDDYSPPELARVDGQDTRLIIDNSAIAGGMFYVTETAKPLIVRFIPSGDGPGDSLNFTYPSAAPSIAAPPAREVIDGSRYGF